jgi:hypothetical protein
MTTPSPPQPGRCGVLVTTDGPLLAAPKGPAPSADTSDARLTSSSGFGSALLPVLPPRGVQPRVRSAAI